MQEEGNGTPNMSDTIKSNYNTATGETGEQKRLSGGKRTSSHPDVAETQTLQPKKVKKTYTPMQSKEPGHYHVVLGEDVEGTPDPNRWKILDLIGEGTFAKVIEAWDRKRHVYVAIKLVRGIEKYTRDAKFEIQILHKIKEDDRGDFYPTIKYRTYFYAQTRASTHMCIVFPKLGFCLLDYLTRCGNFGVKEVAHIAWQLGAALNYLHAHLRLIHTDLKPENILLEDPVETIDKMGNRRFDLPTNGKIRVIDFGGTTDSRHGRTTVVSTRHYRAPEVILGCGWMWAADIWSVGCILVELLTGHLLYNTHDNKEHLCLMEKTLGKTPSWLCEFMTPEGRRHFTESGDLDTSWTQSQGKAAAKLASTKPLSAMRLGDDLLDLIRQCLNYDRTNRIRAYDIMYHPFVLRYYPEAATANAKREAYEKSTFGHILGAPDTPTRVQDPPYTAF
ncbi:Serine/threonine-protein kinase AFC2 [Diplonema papillatum]|nr:Serine/threonine-protein kinase AFC2 [Diplonema papillatum]